MWVTTRIGVLGGVVASGTLLAAAQIKPGEEGRQFNYNTQNIAHNRNGNNWGYVGNNGFIMNSNSIQQQQQQQQQNEQQQSGGASDYMLLQQYATNPGYYDLYTGNAAEFTHDPYIAAATYGTGNLASESTDSSPALSALALLGFLYFLNLIQDVLQNNGRRKRSLTPSDGLLGTDKFYNIEKGDHYFTSYFGEEPGAEIKNQGPVKEDTTLNEVGTEARSFSFLEDFFIRLPEKLGINRMLRIDRGGPDEKPMGIGNFIKTRLKMISSIMSFLQDPSPYRIRRAAQEDMTDELVEDRAIGAFPSPSLDELMPLIREVLHDYDKSQVQPFAPNYLQSEEKEITGKTNGVDDEGNTKSEEGPEQRDRRHTTSSMNAWYRNLNGHSIEQGTQAEKIASKVASLLGNSNSEGLQDALRKNTMPTLVELSKGLAGGHPHCLQRALCRLNSHSHQLSFMPRLALQILSSNLAGTSLASTKQDDNLDAIRAGRRGENCDQTFSECQTSTVLENT